MKHYVPDSPLWSTVNSNALDPSRYTFYTFHNIKIVNWLTGSDKQGKAQKGFEKSMQLF